MLLHSDDRKDWYILQDMILKRVSKHRFVMYISDHFTRIH